MFGSLAEITLTAATPSLSAFSVIARIRAGARPFCTAMSVLSLRRRPSMPSRVVPSASGGHVPLREVASIEKAVGKAAITREANSRMLALKFNVEGRDLGSVMSESIATVQRDVKVPEGNFLVWGGEYENQKRALARLAVIVPFSFLVVFVLLFMALGTVPSALAVLVVAPLAMSGGVMGLAAARIAWERLQDEANRAEPDRGDRIGVGDA